MAPCSALLPRDVDTAATYEAAGVVRAVDAEDRRELLAFPAGTSTAAFGSTGEHLTSTEGAQRWTLAFDLDRSRRWSVQASLGTLQAPFTPCAVSLDGRPLTGWTYDAATTALQRDVEVEDGTVVVNGCRGDRPPGGSAPRAAGDRWRRAGCDRPGHVGRGGSAVAAARACLVLSDARPDLPATPQAIPPRHRPRLTTLIGMPPPPFALPPDAVVYVAGHRGLVGSAITRALQARGHEVLGRTSKNLDLRDRTAVDAYFDAERPTHVFLAAAKVGGILANSTAPADFLSENLRIQVNVMDAAARTGVQRLLFLGSSCIYPKFAEQPIREDSLLTGPLEPTNDAYAIAKIAGIMQVQALRRQHGASFISAMPTNLYGPGDNFDLHGSHVMPAMIRKMHEAKRAGEPTVTLWGTGSPNREFLYVDDLASASLFLLENYDDAQTINVGVGEDLSIQSLAELVQDVVGYEGELVWDTSKPDGTPRKLLDVTRLTDLGWKPSIRLEEGVRATYAWFREHVASDARL